MTEANGGAGDDTRKHLIEELDELHFTLHDSAEYQHDIPLLNEPYTAVEHDFDLDIPILTDPLEGGYPAPSDTAREGFCDTPQPPLDDQSLQQPCAEENPPQQAGQANQSEPTDSDMELESLLDELVAEHLPKLEQKLRSRLRQMIEQGQLDLLDDPLLNNHVDES